MNEDRSMRSRATSSYLSRLGSGSPHYFDFLDSTHSVFSRQSYYSDKQAIHPWLRRPCSRYSGIPYSTLRAGHCSERTDELARPKIKREYLIRQEFFDNVTNYAYSGVKPTALTASCSERLTQLSRAKSIPVGYKFAYDLPRPIPESAFRARLSKRTDELAKPRHNRETYKQSLWDDKQK